MAINDNTFIRFDWAAKRLLRDKANFSILEGLVSVLIGETVKVEEILESEGNQESERDKYNRVDVKAKNSKGEIIIVEIQLTRQIYYIERMLYGVAKAITEHINLGEGYEKIKKVYSISILYCDLGIGTDYVYRGQTSLIGIHSGDELIINQKDRDAIAARPAAKIFPEYYVIRVNEFQKIPETPLDEWVNYLKTGDIKEGTTTPGLTEARERFRVLSMSDKERAAYLDYMDTISTQIDVEKALRLDGYFNGKEDGFKDGLEKGIRQGVEQGIKQGVEQGIKQGLEKGIEQANMENALKMKENGLDTDLIFKITGIRL